MASSVLCQLCNEPVFLESARINEHGKPVHEDCYVESIKIMKPAASERTPDENSAA
jgi:hypothetical protein